MEEIESQILGEESKNFAIVGKEGTGKSTIIDMLGKMLFQEIPKHVYKRGDVLQIRNEDIDICLSETSISSPFNPNSLQEVIKAHAFILVFSVDDDESFDVIEQVKDFILSKRGETVPIMVIGNKSEIPERGLLFEFADLTISVGWEMKYLETSALTGMNVDMILPTLIDVISQSDEDFESYALMGIVIKKNDGSRSRSLSWLKRFSRKRTKSVKESSSEKRNDKMAPNRRSIRNYIGRMMSSRQKTPEPSEQPCRSPTENSLTQLLECEGNEKGEFNPLPSEFSLNPKRD